MKSLMKEIGEITFFLSLRKIFLDIYSIFYILLYIKLFFYMEALGEIQSDVRKIANA